MNPKILNAYATKNNLTTEEAREAIVNTIMAAARSIAPTYRFGYHDVEDIEQEGILIGLEVMGGESYDVDRPLPNFLYTHIRNRLNNYKRDNYARLEAPCECCDGATIIDDMCERRRSWVRRNDAKRSLAHPILTDSFAMNPSTIFEELEFRETLTRIDEGLPPELRTDYLRLRDGVNIPKERRERVRSAIMEILNGY